MDMMYYYCTVHVCVSFVTASVEFFSRNPERSERCESNRVSKPSFCRVGTNSNLNGKKNYDMYT